jgi:acyl carrier protein
VSGGDVRESIRQAVVDHGRLGIDAGSLRDDTDLYGAGMTSHASVNVMLAIEGAFDLEFPDRMLTRSVFTSIDTIAAAILELSGPGAG